MVWQSKVDTSVIHPTLVDVMNHVFEHLAFKGYSGLRTFAEQDELYAKGRTALGGIVTKARGGQSMHNYGCAVDSAPLVDPNKPKGDVHWPDPDTEAGSTWYELEEAVMEAITVLDIDIDIEWGGRWKFRDVPHVQIRTTFKELNAGHYPACRDVEWLKTAHTTFLFDTSWMLRRVQFMLNAVKYDCGPVDGHIGPRTQAVLHDFQDDQHINPENPENIQWVIDKETVRHLVELGQDAR